jgi:hypothetical protein
MSFVTIAVIGLALIAIGLGLLLASSEAIQNYIRRTWSNG